MKTKIKAILGEHDPHTPSILHFTACTTGKCDTGTNQNRGFFTEKCSNDNCNFQREPTTKDIDRWNTDQKYRDKTDLCPKCGNILYLVPKKQNNRGNNNENRNNKR